MHEILMHLIMHANLIIYEIQEIVDDNILMSMNNVNE